jgi:beta-glucosidase
LSFRFGVGIEDTFVLAGGRPLDEYALCGHYERWREDLALAARSGASLLRWGIPWHRVEPAPGEFELDWVEAVFDAAAEEGLELVADLVHYGCPAWLVGAFDHRDYPARVAEYAAAVGERLGARLRSYTALNEPLITAMLCGEAGRWPPALTGDAGFVRVLAQAVRGIVAVRAAMGERTAIDVEATFRWVGADTAHLDARSLLAYDLLFGLVDAEHPLAGWLERHGLDDRDALVSPPDVVGLNYYPHLTTVAVDGGARPYVGAAGLTEVCRAFAARYDRPLMITETSVDGPVERRLAWLEESLDACAALRAEGVPLVGYVWFPLFTLVDWDYREGAGPPSAWFRHMGLADLDERLERHDTPVLAAFSERSRRGL